MNSLQKIITWIVVVIFVFVILIVLFKKKPVEVHPVIRDVKPVETVPFYPCLLGDKCD